MLYLLYNITKMHTLNETYRLQKFSVTTEKDCANVFINNLMSEGMGVNIFEMALNVSTNFGQQVVAELRQRCAILNFGVKQ